MLDHPATDGFVIMSQIEFGDRFAVAGVGPHRFIGMRNRDTHHGRAAAGFHLRRHERVGTGCLWRWFSHFDSLCRRRDFRDDFGRGLVFAESFERARPYHPVAGPSGELDLGDQFGLQPVDARLVPRRVLTLERILVNREFLQSWENSPDDVLAEARANASAIDEMFVAIDSREQRAEAPAFAGPAAEHDF